MGAPPAPPITLPSWPMISDLLASSAASVPPAAPTSGSDLTLASSEAGTVALPLVEPSTISLPEMTASVSA